MPHVGPHWPCIEQCQLNIGPVHGAIWITGNAIQSPTIETVWCEAVLPPSSCMESSRYVMQPLVKAGNTKTSNLFTALLAQTFFTVTTVEHEYLYYQCKEKYEHKNPCQTSTGHPFLATAWALVFKTEVNLESHSWSPRCKHLNFVLNRPQHKC